MRFILGCLVVLFFWIYCITVFVHDKSYRVQLQDKTITTIETNTTHNPGEIVKGYVNIFNYYIESADGNIRGIVLNQVKRK